MRNPIDIAVGRRVAALRAEKGLTLAELALSTNCSIDEIAAIEAGAHVSAARLLLIQQALNVNIDAFFDVTGFEPDEAFPNAVATREGLILVGVFARIRNASSRALLIELAHHLAALEGPA